MSQILLADVLGVDADLFLAECIRWGRQSPRSLRRPTLVDLRILRVPRLLVSELFRSGRRFDLAKVADFWGTRRSPRLIARTWLWNPRISRLIPNFLHVEFLFLVQGFGGRRDRF